MNVPERFDLRRSGDLNAHVMSMLLNNFFFNRIEGGELFERVIDDDFILTEKSCTVFMRQICEGIEFVHKQNILHLDMKVSTIESIITDR